MAARAVAIVIRTPGAGQGRRYVIPVVSSALRLVEIVLNSLSPRPAPYSSAVSARPALPDLSNSAIVVAAAGANCVTHARVSASV